MMIEVGDVLVVRGTDWASRLIRLGAALKDEPNLDNHVAIVHHQDANGVWCGPGGVGWADAHNYLTSPYTTNNVGQCEGAEQRDRIAAVARGCWALPTTGPELSRMR